MSFQRKIRGLMQRRGWGWLDAAKGHSAHGVRQPWVKHSSSPVAARFAPATPISLMSKTDATLLTYLRVSVSPTFPWRCKQDDKDLLSYLLSPPFGLPATTSLRAQGQTHCVNTGTSPQCAHVHCSIERTCTTSLLLTVVRRLVARAAGGKSGCETEFIQG